METFRATSETIACTLTPDELGQTRKAWQKLLRLSLISRLEVAGGLRLEFHPRGEHALRQLVDVERECCRWITFELESSVLTVTSTGAGEAVIREMWLPVV